MHTLVAKQDHRWLVAVREHSSVAWSIYSQGPNLEVQVDAALKLFRLPDDWSFTTREASEAMADVAETAEALPAVDPQVRITIFAPEGRFETGGDRWAVMAREARSLQFWAAGMDGLFRPHTLAAQMRTWFETEGWRTFAKAHGLAQLNYGRELYVRPAWRARGLLPNDFPPLRLGPALAPEQEARRLARLPQNKKAAKRQQMQQTYERHKAQAAERAAARAAAQNS